MKIREALLAGVRGLGLALLSMVGSLVLFILSVVAMSLSFAIVGLFLTPLVTTAARNHANLRRRLAYEWFGVRIEEPYAEAPRFQGGVIGVLERYRWIMKDPATWRDLLWMLFDATAGFTLGTLAFTLPLYGPYGCGAGGRRVAADRARGRDRLVHLRPDHDETHRNDRGAGRRRVFRARRLAQPEDHGDARPAGGRAAGADAPARPGAAGGRS